MPSERVLVAAEKWVACGGCISSIIADEDGTDITQTWSLSLDEEESTSRGSSSSVIGLGLAVRGDVGGVVGHDDVTEAWNAADGNEWE